MADVVTVPFIDLWPYVQLVAGRQGVGSRLVNDQDSFLGSAWDTLRTLDFIGTGAITKRFESALADKVKAPYAVACANGTDALMLALRAMGIGRGARVALPNLTFWATYEAVVNVGATPVLLDIDPDDLQLSFDEFVRAANKRQFDAAILVHLYGWCSRRLGDFRSFCRNRRITLIEDGAQAFGVKVAGESIFADADIATLSFHPAKVLGGIGDSGAVLCKSARTAAQIRMLANHGRAEHFQHLAVGWNSRLDSIQAAWLLRALEVSDKVIEARRRAARNYGDWAPENVTSNGYLDVSITHDRAAWQEKMRARGIGTGCVYPSTIIDNDGAHDAIALGPLHTSRDVARMVVNRPLFYGITDEQVDRVLEASE